jgi:DNA-binding beta-propeller fold protein YncE
MTFPKRIAAALMIVLVFLSLVAAAQAAESVYWVNYQASKVSRAPIGEGSGIDLPIPSAFVDGPYGLTIDAAAGKIYWINYNSNTIGYANLDGTGAGLLNTSGTTVTLPGGLAIDPATGRLYWGNAGNNTISFANVNGTGGGTLSTSGATVDEPYGVAVDPSLGRVYWTNYSGVISYARLDGSGGTDLNITGVTIEGPEGLAIDGTNNKVYWADNQGNSIGYAGVDGGPGGTLTQVAAKAPVGIAIEPAFQNIYWADEGFNQIGTANLLGAATAVPATTGATLAQVAFPVLLRSPLMAQLPGVQGKHTPGSTLTCSAGSWAADQAEAFHYRAPQSFSYQWLRNKKPISGATTSAFVASKVGAYTCEVKAANFAGSDTETSPEFKVNATVAFKRVAFNRKKGTATLRVAVTGAGRLDVYGKGVANVSRKKATGIVKLTVRSSGKARIKLKSTGRARVKATISYTPEGGKAIKRRKTVVLKKKLR